MARMTSLTLEEVKDLIDILDWKEDGVGLTDREIGIRQKLKRTYRRKLIDEET